MIPQLNADTVVACTGAEAMRAEFAADALNEVVPLYALTTVNRLGMFLANVGHETGNLKWNTELWGPSEAQARYDTRTDLGNLYLGDGYRYRGRGWFQTTGRANYLRLTQRLKARFPAMPVPDFVASPDFLAQTQWCALSAADYADQRRLNAVADSGDFDGYCDIINLGHKGEKPGMSNGFKDRQQLWGQAYPALLLAGFDNVA